MCAIVGWTNGVSGDALDKILRNASERGRDGWGFWIDGEEVRGEGSVFDHKEVYEKLLYSKMVVGNFRATPTTESETDISILQPYKGIVHNGVIANDKDFGDFKIDSMCLPQLIRNTDYNNRYEFLKALKGSFALAWSCEEGSDDVIRFACNYKPIFAAQHHRGIVFASMPYMLPSKFTTQIEPYSYGYFYDDSIITVGHLDREQPNKALVACSSGLDSTTVAYMLKAEGYEVSLVHFNYGCLAESVENKRIKEIAEHGNFGLVFMDLPKIALGGTLVNGDFHSNGVEGAEYAHDWISARNLLMLSTLTAYAETHKYGYIAFGGNLEEAGSYCLLDTANNKIRLWNGEFKTPSEIKKGDTLISYNTDIKKVQKATVTRTTSREVDSYYEFTVHSGRKWKDPIKVKAHSFKGANQYKTFKIKQKSYVYTKKEYEKTYSATGEHPFFVKGKGFTPLKDIKVGDIIMNYTDAVQQERCTHSNYSTKINMSGMNNPMYGHIRSNTTKCWCGKKHAKPDAEKISKTMKETANDPEYKERVSKGVRKHYENRTEAQKAQHSSATKEGIQKATKSFEKETGYEHWNSTPDRRKASSDVTKKLIKDGIINPATMSGERPTKVEKEFIKYFKKNTLDFRYVGDGQVWITAKGKHMNPDFINMKKKQVIEVTSHDYWKHNPQEMRRRVKAFASVGWSCVYLTTADFKNDKALEKIYKKFHGIKNGVVVTSKKLVRKPAKVYNFTCTPNHNYFLGSNGMLTHNCDNEEVFGYNFNKVLHNSVQNGVRVELLHPLSKYMKHEIIKIGNEVKVPWELTWSCYSNGDKPCGTCGPCFMRKKAFERNNSTDPLLG